MCVDIHSYSHGEEKELVSQGGLLGRGGAMAGL